MRKMIAFLLVLALSFVGCTTLTSIGEIRSLGYPIQSEGAQLGVRIRSGSGVDEEAISVDQDMVLPVQASLEPNVSDCVPIPGTLAIGLIIAFIVHDITDSVQISMGNVI